MPSERVLKCCRNECSNAFGICIDVKRMAAYDRRLFLAGRMRGFKAKDLSKSVARLLRTVAPDLRLVDSPRGACTCSRAIQG